MSRLLCKLKSTPLPEAASSAGNWHQNTAVMSDNLDHKVILVVSPSHFRIHEWCPLDARMKDGSKAALHGLITAFIDTRMYKDQYWTASHDEIST